jgi:hypothetical protein
MSSKGINYCIPCSKWIEDIDFLSESERLLADKGCKECKWLVKTEYTKNDLPLFYCNNGSYKGSMEKINDFRECKFKENKSSKAGSL